MITITPELTKAERKLLKDLLKESKKFPDGLHYFEKYHEYKREQFLSGIVWPIIVATITSLIANMPNWLPWLIKLLK